MQRGTLDRYRDERLDAVTRKEPATSKVGIASSI